MQGGRIEEELVWGVFRLAVSEERMFVLLELISSLPLVGKGSNNPRGCWLSILGCGYRLAKYKDRTLGPSRSPPDSQIIISRC